MPQLLRLSSEHYLNTLLIENVYVSKRPRQGIVVMASGDRVKIDAEEMDELEAWLAHTAVAHYHPEHEEDPF